MSGETLIGVAVAIVLVAGLLALGLRFSSRSASGGGSAGVEDTKRYAKIAQERRRQREELMSRLESMLEADEGADGSVRAQLDALRVEHSREQEDLALQSGDELADTSSESFDTSESAGSMSPGSDEGNSSSDKQEATDKARRKEQAAAQRQRKKDQEAADKARRKEQAAEQRQRKKDQEAADKARREEQRTERKTQKKLTKEQTKQAQNSVNNAASYYSQQANEAAHTLQQTQHQAQQENSAKDKNHHKPEPRGKNSFLTRKKENPAPAQEELPQDATAEERMRYETDLTHAELSAAARQAAAAAAKQAANARSLFETYDDAEQQETPPQQEQEPETSPEDPSYTRIKVASIVDYHSYGLPEDLPEAFQS